VWSRDAQWLVFRRDGLGVMEDLAATRPGIDSVSRALFTTGTATEKNVTFSPDGRWIAFTSNETGQTEVYVRPFPDVSLGKWRVSDDGGTEPIWSRDGSEIFYRSGSNHILSATVTMEATFRVVEKRVLFDGSAFRRGGMGRSYDVAPDGTRFIMIQSGLPRDAPRELVLVHNLAGELTAAARSATERGFRER